MPNKNKSQIIEGSHAIALTINNIKPAVVSAYPITPQTHIVEDLAKFKADGLASFEYVRAESEFAAASVVLGASATGVRVYTATSSQGLLLMTEVVFNIGGMRLPIVMTCANRGVSAPITIWNDQQDAVTVRDAGWIMMFAENNQEAIEQHILAYKIAEQLSLPVMVNVDGFVLTHTYEPVTIPTSTEIKKYLTDYKPKVGHFLDPKNPITMGAFARPAYYMEIREDLHKDIMASANLINKEYINYHKQVSKQASKISSNNNGLIEYTGPKTPKIVLVAMGSVIGTMKEAIKASKDIGILKIKTFRPFPSKEVSRILNKVKYVAVLDKSISLGQVGPLASEVKTAVQGKSSDCQTKIQSFIVGLGGRDITRVMIKKIINEVQKNGDEMMFVGKE